MSCSKLLIYLFALCLLSHGALAATLSEVPFDSLPDAVKTTALNIIDKPNISKVSKIDDNGLVRFEIEADKTENNRPVVSWDVVIAVNGKIMKLAKEVPFFELSYPQMQAMEQRYPGIKVIEAESVDLHFLDVIGTVDGQDIKLRLYEDGLIEEQSSR
ncbi:hypothetical protein [Methylomonas rapida]|jgi:hypothetical protein|uniref:Beta-lactamase-inhibitor-like PepSY-like domain-containing protein n=1 Tax=Methylomonas rapida TaxID=2963939 RepID=A0ABY7GJA4_9GAMM|nr:hypothetical protein [Methylomonas rapida]WAR44348.1 hypothetical protein NM686_018620 [Methylomonas rapida]